MRLLLSGMIGGVPGQGGAAWAVLQYLLGFERLGHEVVFVEPVAADSLRPPGARLGQSENARYLREALGKARLERSSAMLLAGTEETFGAPYGQLLELARGADMLVNVSGMLADERLIGGIPVRVWLDLDPAFNQLWHVTGKDMGFARHTHFVTVGQAIGSPESQVPTCGLTWMPTLPPVVLPEWPTSDRMVHDAFTTVGHWRSYGPIEHDGVRYGQKAHSFRHFMSLPQRTSVTLLPALAIHSDEKQDLAALSAHGWQLADPTQVADTPDHYRAFVRGSRAELALAKSGYVAARCGWFSDRSACYLASGRPVVAQETGFSAFLPAGEGLLAFETIDEAVAAVDSVQHCYQHHAGAARALAEKYFDSDRVLGALLDRITARR